MTQRLLFTILLLGAGAGSIAIAASGCSSSTTPPGSGTHTGGSDSGNEGEDAGTGGETGSGADSGGHDGAIGADGGGESDGSHDAPAPDALYGCAVMGSFGWTCTATATGPDPTECTDPNFPDCFVGGQGAWCTKTCASVSDCADDGGGCTPSGCNTKGYCK